MKQYLRRIAVLALLMFCGCSSFKEPGSASFASVRIANRSVDEIRDASILVFEAAGYETFETVGGDLVFEKEGTRSQQLMRGGLIDDSPVNERVRTEIVSVSGGHRLQCKVYMVQEAGHAFFEDETRLANIRSRPYQKLLDQVAQRLK